MRLVNVAGVTAKSYSDAIKLGVERYFTGLPCKRGHVSQRLTKSRHCVECKREFNARCGPVYRVINREKDRKRIRKWAQENVHKRRAHVKKWRIKNPGRWKPYIANRRARKKAAAGRFTYDDTRRLLEIQKRKCAYCKVDLAISGTHIDHIIPLSKGGSNWPNNLQLLCPLCNGKKHNKDPIEFAQSLGRLL